MKNDKSTATLLGTVDKIIVSKLHDGPDKAQISVEGGEPLYREIRIANTLIDKEGDDVSLEVGQAVEVTVKADTKDTTGTE